MGPNATGKTLFAEQLRQQCLPQGLKPRYLNAERLTGLEKRNYDWFAYSHIDRGLDISQFQTYKNQGMNYGLAADAFVILKQKPDMRIKIEASLSQLFGRRIRLAEEGGFLKPKVQRIRIGGEYGLKENECHGLKELITLLTFLYDDEYDCLIIDEPELHLHPQFQTLLLQEIRRIAGDPRTDPGKKCFFIITHSPYYVDIRTPEELKHCIVFQPEKLPTYVNGLEGEDERRVRRLLPRLNTHHKQFFFASRPIFVEGYFDQHLFTLIQEKRGKLLGASGACIIDINGKEEMDLFFTLCKKLNIDAQFVSDLDTLFHGKLRRSVSEDDRCKEYLQREGLGVDLGKPLGEVEQAIDDCVKEIETASDKMTTLNSSLRPFHDALSEADKIRDERNRISKKRYILILGLKLIRGQIESFIPAELEKLNFIQGRLLKIIKAFQQCGVYLLSRGELENYLPSYDGNPYVIPDNVKTEAFERERDFILSTDLSEDQFRSRYGELVTILDEASHSTAVSMDTYLGYTIADWIHKVQSAFVRGEVRDKESLETNVIVEWATYSRIFELSEFSTTADGFTCRIKLKPLVDPSKRDVTFNNTTVAANFKLNTDPPSANTASAV